MSRLVYYFALSVSLAPAANAFADDAGLQFFEEKIRPVLIEHCYRCHSSETDEPAGGLLLDSREGIRAGGETGPAIVPSDVDESLLISAIGYEDLEMPPGEMLDEQIVEDFRTWIEMGAPDPRGETPPKPKEDPRPQEAESGLWSLKPVALPAVPEVADMQWPAGDIDRFILSNLEAHGLRPASDATPLTLLRRLHFDLAGLPPAADDISSFLASSSEAAIESTVDKLLASPAFGERWGRHWLDVVRYGESTGSSRDVLMLYSWKYRDYVIDALNADLPYDQFIREQIAGDLLLTDDPAERRRYLTATGLLAIGSKSLNGGNLTLDIVDDQIDVVGKAVLGLTISCARCHDHKFDPIPTADYYALAGIFRNTQTFYGGSTKRPRSIKEKLQVYLPLSSEFSAAEEEITKLQTQITAAEKKLSQAEKRLKTQEGKLPADVRKKLKTITPDIDPQSLNVSPKSLAALKAYQATQRQLESHKLQIRKLREQEQGLPAADFAFAVQDQKNPRDWPIQVRGDKGKAGDVVPRGFLSCVNSGSEFPIGPQESGRRQLAKWLCQPEHPLTSRVIVNRVWQHLFGAGLVSTVNNFGKSGNSPSNPLLLDYLASRFVKEHNWSLKTLIKEIVLCRTYRLSTEFQELAWEHDPENQLHWRANRRRLEAEAIRDAMLTASGQLDLSRPEGSVVQQIGEGEVGRNINTKPLERPFPHRSVYLPIIRGLLPEILKVFDFPEPSNPAGRRSETTVPTQSLYLMNSPFVQQQAKHMADRLLQAASDEPGRIRYLWLSCFGRLPTEDEIRNASAFLNEVRADAEIGEEWRVLSQCLFASAEFRFVD